MPKENKRERRPCLSIILPPRPEGGMFQLAKQRQFQAISSLVSLDWLLGNSFVALHYNFLYAAQETCFSFSPVIAGPGMPYKL